MKKDQKEMEDFQKFAYDEACDILYCKVDDRDYAVSEEHGNIITDFDAEGNIMGIQVMDASKELNIPKEFLEALRDATLVVVKEGNTAKLTLTLSIKNGTHEEVYTQHITAPLQRKEASTTH